MSVETEIDLVSAYFWERNPHDELTWMRKHAPVWRDLNTSGIWGVATYELVKYCSTHPELFSSATGCRPDFPASPNMVDMDDPAHRNRRQLVSRGFTPRRVAEKEASIRRIVDELIDAVCERGECDIVWDIAAWLPLIVIADALGVEPADREQLLHWSEDLMGMLGQGSDEAMVRAMAAAAGFGEYVARVVAARRASPTDDLMGILVHAEVDGEKLSDRDLVAESMLILNGGDETTRHVIAGGMYELLREPRRWEEIRADRSLLPGAIEEMLRWVSPIKNMARSATRDITLGGQTIPAGEQILLLYPSANRDESVFEDPFRFDIRRTPNEHVAFGFGPHFCLGSNLAKLELRVVLEQMLDRFPDLALASDEEPSYRAANFVSGITRLNVTFTPTKPLAMTA